MKFRPYLLACSTRGPEGTVLLPDIADWQIQLAEVLDQSSHRSTLSKGGILNPKSSAIFKCYWTVKLQLSRSLLPAINGET